MFIKYYLIHCLEHEERMNHINKLKKKLINQSKYFLVYTQSTYLLKIS